MDKTTKAQDISVFLLGAAAVLLSLLVDVFHGRQFSFGYAQGICLLFGIMTLVSVWFHRKGRFAPFLKNIQKRYLSKAVNLPPTIKSIKLLDLIILFVFLLYASLYFLGRWGGLAPVLLVDKTGDAGALLSYAAALDAPQNFANDQILDPAKHMFSYNGIYLPYIRWVAGIFGDYGLALLTLLPLCFFLHLTSFYLLGKELFKHRFWAFLLSVLTAVPIVYGFWDSWGLAYDPLPRFLFQSIAPFLFLLAIKWRHTPRYWPWLMLAISLLFFIHVISAPAIASMIWGGFFIAIPKTWKISKKLLFQLLNGLAFLIPYALLVLSSNSTPGITTTSGANYAEIMQYLNINFTAFLNITKSLFLYIKVLNYYMLLIPAVLGIIVIYMTKTHRELHTSLVLIWLGACILVSILIPSIEHAIENRFGVPPLEFDLVRNLRYSIPLLEIIGISGFIAIQRHLSNSYSAKLPGKILAISIYMIAGAWVLYSATLEADNDRKYGLDFAVQEIKCVARGELFCPTLKQTDEAAVLAFIKNELPITSVFLSMPEDELANEIRYAGMRSVGYTHIDKNRIAYSHLKKAIEVEEINMEWSDALKTSEDGFGEWAHELSCDYAVTHWMVEKETGIGLENETSGIRQIFMNQSFSVLELPQCQ